MLASALKDMAVVSLGDGAKIGNVQDVLFDAQALRVSALLLRTGGGQSALPFETIRTIGTDAITVENATAAQGISGQTSLDALRGLGDLLGLPVVTSEGTHLGAVSDIEIEQQDGRLVGITAQQGGVFGIGAATTTVPAAAIRSFGPKVATVEMTGDANAGGPETAPQ